MYYLIGSIDYSPGRYNVTFLAGMTDTSFTITILNDNEYEGSETFDVIISNVMPDRVTMGKIRRATVTIIDSGKLLLYKTHIKT